MSTPDTFEAFDTQAAGKGAVAPTVATDIAPLERFVAPPHAMEKLLNQGAGWSAASHPGRVAAAACDVHYTEASVR